MPLFSLDELEAAVPLVRRDRAADAAVCLAAAGQAHGREVWVKHENHTPIGAFKVRGGIIYLDALEAARARSSTASSRPRAATTASRSRSPAARAGVPCTIFVPHGNSREKNAAMRAFGAELIVHGRDFDEAGRMRRSSPRSAAITSCRRFDADLVKGVATYALELFRAVADLDAVYVPIGMGSGICGLITARDLLGLKTEIVGVVAESGAGGRACRSSRAGRCRPTRRPPSPTAWPAAIPSPSRSTSSAKGAARIVRVTRGRDRRGHAGLLRGHPQPRGGRGRGAARGPACRSASGWRASASG